MKFKKLLITGGAGFIGSEVARQAVKKGYDVVVVDKLTYAGDLARLKDIRGKYKFYKADICDKKAIDSIFKQEKPGTVMHLAAESHVDRSIADASPFIRTNFEGTQVILDAARKRGTKRLIHMSTDEIYGEIEKGKFSEKSPPAPNSPYSASKAAADMLAQAYYRTYDLPVIIARPCNNYGPWQYPEKLVPVVIKKAIRNEKVPIYARGLNMREWLYVSDCARALFSILEKGKVGEIYNVGSGQERKNIDTAGLILDVLGKSHGLIEFVKDRPGHDLRYSLDSKKIKQHTGWSAKVKFETGIKETVAWYTGNSRWLFDADSGEKFKRRGILKLMGSNCWQGNSAQMRRGRF